MDRRDFLSRTGTAAALIGWPAGQPIMDWQGALTPIPTADKKQLADIALELYGDRKSVV